MSSEFNNSQNLTHVRFSSTESYSSSAIETETSNSFAHHWLIPVITTLCAAVICTICSCVLYKNHERIQKTVFSRMHSRSTPKVYGDNCSSSISPDNSASAKSNPVVELSHFTLTSLDETSVTDLDESKIFSTSPVCTLTSSLDSSMSQLSSTTRSPANKPTTLVGPRKPPVKLPPLTVKTSLVTAKPSGGPIVIQPDLPNIPPYLVMLKTLQEPLKPLPPKPIFLQEKSSMGGSLSQNMYPSSDSEQDD